MARLGPSVRHMGVWRHGSDGSLEVSVANVAEAARQLRGPAKLITELGSLHREQFEQKVRCYQDAKDPAEVQKLAGEISQELFGA